LAVYGRVIHHGTTRAAKDRYRSAVERQLVGQHHQAIQMRQAFLNRKETNPLPEAEKLYRLARLLFRNGPKRQAPSILDRFFRLHPSTAVAVRVRKLPV
jgi:hypothetical protein